MSLLSALVASLLLSAALFAPHAAAATPQPSPWPISGHDSGFSCAAGKSVPVYAFYDNASLSLQWPDDGKTPSAFIPAQGIYVVCDSAAADITVYNRTTASTYVLQGPSPYVIGFDPASSLRLYFYNTNNWASFGAYSLQTRSNAWSFSNESMTIVQYALDTFTDSVYVSYFAGDHPFIARYDGATGKVLWIQETGGANYEPQKLLCNLPSGAIVSQESGQITVLTARDSKTGNVLWTFDAQKVNEYAVYGSLALGDVLVINGNSVYAINSTTGAFLWNHTDSECSMMMSGPFASIQIGATLGVVTACEDISGKLLKWYLQVLDSRSGKVLYRINTGEIGNPMQFMLATVGANVFYGALGVFRWNPLTAQITKLYESDRLIGGLYVDGDGSLLVLPTFPEPLVLISPHLH